MQVKMGEKEYNCWICGRNFQTNESVRMKTEEKYSARTQLNEHKETVTEKVTIIHLVGKENQNEAAVHQRENLN